MQFELVDGGERRRCCCFSLWWLQKKRRMPRSGACPEMTPKMKARFDQFEWLHLTAPPYLVQCRLVQSGKFITWLTKGHLNSILIFTAILSQNIPLSIRGCILLNERSSLSLTDIPLWIWIGATNKIFYFYRLAGESRCGNFSWTWICGDKQSHL